MPETSHLPTVMLEKWLLVVVIVGCTSLIFLVCFPIDFYLYRRRKRLARKRGPGAPFYPRPDNTRAAQMHSRVSMTTSTLSLGDSPENEDEKPVSSATKEWVVRTKLVRLVNLFRKQKRQKLLQMRQLSVSTTSELRSDVPRAAVTPEPSQQGVDNGITDTVSLSTRKDDDELRASRNSADRYGNKGNVHNPRDSANTRVGKTVANIESHRGKEIIPDNIGHRSVDVDNKQANMNYGLEKQMEDKFCGSHLNQLSMTPKEASRLNVDIEDCIGPDNYKLNLSAGDSASDEISDDLAKGETEYAELHDSNLEIIQVRSRTSTQDTSNLHSKYDRRRYKINNFKKTKSKTIETMDGSLDIDEHGVNQRFRKLSSEPNLNITNSSNINDGVAFEPLAMSYSEDTLGEDPSKHRRKPEYSHTNKDALCEQDEETDDSNRTENGKRKKRRPKPLGVSDESIAKRTSKKRKKKAFLQKLAASSLPEISIDDNLNRESDVQ